MVNYQAIQNSILSSVFSTTILEEKIHSEQGPYIAFSYLMTPYITIENTPNSSTIVD